MLHLDIEGTAAGIAKREVGKQEASDAAVFDDVPGTTDDHSGDAIRFEVSGNQTHGLVTDRSNRDEDGGIDRILLTPLQDL